MKKSIFLFVLSLGIFFIQTTANATYQDVAEDSPYKEGVDYLELVGATDDAENFRPNALVTKAEFYKVLFKVFQDELPTGKTRFSDVPEDAWFAPYAHLAQNNQLEEGAVFEPTKTLKKIEVYEKLLAAYGITGGIAPWSQRQSLFSDISSVHPYYSVISKLVDEGILEANTQSALMPYNRMKRGDFANTILRFEQWYFYKQELEESEFYKSDIFADIWNTIANQFYLEDNQEIDPDALFNAAVKGMLESLGDPFTTYFTPDQSNEFQDSLSGNFEGIGAYINQDELTGEFTFSGFIAGSPAESSGLKQDDILLEVDGVSTEGMSLAEVISRIKGPAGTEVLVTIERNEKTYEYRITRATVEIKLVTGDVLDKKVWYIDVDVFGTTTVANYLTTVESLKAKAAQPKAIILDLRSNGGGFLNAAIQLAGDFLPQFSRLVTLDYGEYSEDIVNAEEGRFQNIPLYILVNGYTASASEILAQDLKEMAGATVIGTQTYGKGSAQTLTTFWDGSVLKMTIAHWLSGMGTSIHEQGITPDVTIPTGESSAEDLWLEAAQKRIDRL